MAKRFQYLTQVQVVRHSSVTPKCLDDIKHVSDLLTWVEIIEVLPLKRLFAIAPQGTTCLLTVEFESERQKAKGSHSVETSPKAPNNW